MQKAVVFSQDTAGIRMCTGIQYTSITVILEKSWDTYGIKIKIKIKPFVNNMRTSHSLVQNINSISNNSSSLAQLTTKTSCNVA
ncbi:hypothetical protein E2C01_087786 [Portunus trituberculatus]|uniref:Uncharacterized protein n=1 Tax=Portunus trituberculatus TaxID=210409 RepID=A0A5B7J931_PORTR|nr:hypothetical protein [Portunus trituberculatus]